MGKPPKMGEPPKMGSSNLPFANGGLYGAEVMDQACSSSKVKKH